MTAKITAEETGIILMLNSLLELYALTKQQLRYYEVKAATGSEKAKQDVALAQRLLNETKLAISMFTHASKRNQFLWMQAARHNDLVYAITTCMVTNGISRKAAETYVEIMTELMKPVNAEQLLKDLKEVPSEDPS